MSEDDVGIKRVTLETITRGDGILKKLYDIYIPDFPVCVFDDVAFRFI